MQLVGQAKMKGRAKGRIVLSRARIFSKRMEWCEGMVGWADTGPTPLERHYMVAEEKKAEDTVLKRYVL
jgi:hypothetical protein